MLKVDVSTTAISVRPSRNDIKNICYINYEEYIFAMDIGTIATILALMLSVYTLIPSSRRQEVRLKVSWTTIVYLIVIMGLLLFLQFNTTIINLTQYYLEYNLSNLYQYSPVTRLIDKDEVILILLILAILPFTSFTKKLHPRQYKKFVDLCYELYHEKKYKELTDLIAKNRKEIKMITHREYFSAQAKDTFARFVFKHSDYPKILLHNFFKHEENVPEPGLIQKLTAKTKLRFFNTVKQMCFGRMLHYNTNNESFADACIDMFQDDEFLEFLSTRNSRTLLSLIDSGVFDGSSLSSLLRFAVLNRKSFLYKEFRYDHIEHSVTEYLLEKPERCEKWGLWFPMGETLISYLDDLHIRGVEVDPYNREMGDFMDSDGKNEKLDSPIFLVTIFFRRMTISALEQGIKWHMWLYYYRYFVDGISRNLSKEEHQECEFPTRYHYLTWEILQSMTDLIDIVVRKKEITHQDNARIDEVKMDHDNGNIVHSAMRCLGQCLRSIMESDSFTDYDKRYYLRSIFHTYFRLATTEGYEKYAELMLTFIKVGGSEWQDPLDTRFIVSFLRESDFRFKVGFYEKVDEAITFLGE